MSGADNQNLPRPVGGCPCLYVGGCSYACTCANPLMSGGCRRCVSYGSGVQRLAQAMRLAALIDAGRLEEGPPPARSNDKGLRCLYCSKPVDETWTTADHLRGWRMLPGGKQYHCRDAAIED